MTNNVLKARLNPTKFRNFLRRLDREAQIGAREAMFIALEELTKRILAEVPVGTGTLKESYSYQVIDKGDTITGFFGFGWEKNPINPKSMKPVTAYMLRVHEDLEAHHTVGKAKFLEDPVRQFNKDFRNIATTTIFKKIGGRKI